MNSEKSLLKVFLFLVVLVFVFTLFIDNGFVFAQGSSPDGQSNTAVATAIPSSNSGDGVPGDENINSQSGDGAPDAMKSPAMGGGTAGLDGVVSGVATTASYYQLLGTAFNPRTSSTTFAYNFNGCVYETAGSDNRFMAPLLIPNGSIIKYLRLYYNDTSAGTDITAWLTRYMPGSTSEDLTSVTSSGSAGYGSSLSPELTHVVDTVNWAYTVIIAPNGNSSANTFCGIRVLYYAPTFSALALPLINK
ncbi:MAG: hypothetical protein OHK0031_02660 [Anaerolineales bacterium]